MVRIFVLLVFPSPDDTSLDHLSVILKGNTMCGIIRTLALDGLVASMDSKVLRVRKVAKGQIAYRPVYPPL